MKSGITAAIFACQALKELGFKPAHSLILETVVGEESGGVGTLTTLVKGIRAAAAIIMEPTKLQICPVQSGALSFRIRVAGRAIHASMKILGVSAIEKFYLIFHALEDLDRARHARYRNSLFEFPDNVAPICVGTLRSGEWPSTVPDELIAEGRFGIFPGEPLAEARAEFEACIQACSQADEWLAKHPPVIEWFEGQFESSETSVNEPIAKTLAACHGSVTGKSAGVYGAPYGSDQRLFTNHGYMPTVLYGPGDVALAHTVEEYVPLDEVFTCAKVLAHVVLLWCGS
jgi:acetylornithine deacetylase